MSLAELTAADVDADASSPSLSLFVLCSRSIAQRSNDSLHIQLLDPPGLYEADVASRHKPRALDCSGSSFVQSVEKALNSESQSKSRFEFRWSRQKRTLTLMERSEFAMKFCAIEFVESQSKWSQLLHQVATCQKEDKETIAKMSSKVVQVEALLEQKEKLLETALEAKQKTEDRLVEGFCKVLNAKKDEIRKLQYEVERAQELQKFGVKTTTKRKMPSKKRAKGAKLKREVEEEDEEMSDESTKEESGSTASEEDEEDNGTQLKRAKRDAVKAYSQLPANLRTSSVQISSAEDLLSSMDDIIKNEEEVDAATARGTSSSQGVKSKPVKVSEPSSIGVSKSPKTSRARNASVIKPEPAIPPKVDPVKSVQPTKPQVDEPMDSEEEDILDMLS